MTVSMTGSYGEIPTKKEPISTLGSTPQDYLAI